VIKTKVYLPVRTKITTNYQHSAATFYDNDSVMKQLFCANDECLVHNSPFLKSIYSRITDLR